MNNQNDTIQPHNKLINEKSPYLQQHATNPVQWYPWKKETFELAKEMDKPIFLSIGYSTCHWCHVMEKESFEDEEVAKLLNEYFISIKVDREERPDIDNVYMTVTQAMTGSGGWPNSIFMTPDKEPFFAGTYFPKHGFGNRPGMIDLVPHFGKLWEQQKSKLTGSAKQITTEIKKITPTSTQSKLDKEILYQPYRDLSVNFDTEFGGFGTAPKFPTPHQLTYLLRIWKHEDHPNALMMVEKTLNMMRLGGIFDQIGFGFHRYSTDRKWLVPHFEKMLYDQALLAMVYTDAYQETTNPFYAKTVEEILNYVITKLSVESGGFYAAEDADSEGEEGLFYLWTWEELDNVLNSSERETFNKLFNIRPEGNFQEESTGRSNGKNIPYMKNNLSHFAHKFEIDTVKLENEINEIRKKLYLHREKRIHPFKDKKILTDWNGLMIGAFAKAGKVLNNKDYLNSAERAVDFILKHLLDDEGKLLKRYCDGEAALPAHLNDYAYFVWGLIELYEASFKSEYLQLAKNFTDKMITLFHDDQEGGFFLAGNDSDLFLKSKEIYDGATPSGNSVAAMNLLRLSKLLGATDYREKAGEIFDLFADQIKRNPTAFTHMLSAYDFRVHSSHEIVIVGRKNSQITRKILNLINQKYLPNTVVLFKDIEDSSLEKIAEYTANYKMINDKTTIYLCKNFSCKAPITDLNEFKGEISKL